MGEAQLIELLQGACNDQENSPSAAIPRHDVDGTGKDDEQGPEPPEAADRNDSQVIEQEGEADQNEERAGDDAAAAATAERYADHHGTTPGVRFFITVIQAGMNSAMNLIVKVIGKLLLVKIFLVAHGILLLSSRCALRCRSLINVLPL